MPPSGYDILVMLNKFSFASHPHGYSPLWPSVFSVALLHTTMGRASLEQLRTECSLTTYDPECGCTARWDPTSSVASSSRVAFGIVDTWATLGLPIGVATATWFPWPLCRTCNTDGSWVTHTYLPLWWPLCPRLHAHARIAALGGIQKRVARDLVGDRSISPIPPYPLGSQRTIELDTGSV
jgi:hypothetical protein